MNNAAAPKTSGRQGVSYENIVAAAENIVAAGGKPTLRGIRKHLGTGSLGTIQQHLKAWRQGRAPAAPVDASLPSSLQSSALPAEIAGQAPVARADLNERLRQVELQRDGLIEENARLEKSLSEVAAAIAVEKPNHPMTTIAYEFDVIAWAQQQAALLRSGRFDLLDIEHMADEIEDVGKSEKREIRSRMAVLLAHLLKWQYQPQFRGNGWRRTIKLQRAVICDCLDETPSLKADLKLPGWWSRTWNEGVAIAIKDTGLDVFPEICPWTYDQIMDADFWPEA